MNSEIKVQLCKEDFYLMMRNAVLQAGGADKLEEWKKMKFEDLVNRFAQNGVRMVYMPEKHMDSIKIVWQDPKSNSAADLTASAYSKIPFTPPNQPYSPPKKKQLLFDQMDRSDEEDGSWNPAG